MVNDYIYVARSKTTHRGYIGQDTHDISTLQRPKEHISSAYAETGRKLGAANLISKEGLCNIEWAFFPHYGKQGTTYGINNAVFDLFKQQWDIKDATDLDLAELFYIILSKDTSKLANYNILIGGQNTIDLEYKLQSSNFLSYGNNTYDITKINALQNSWQQIAHNKNNTFHKDDLTLARFTPANAWRKVVYPMQYIILDNILQDIVKDYLQSKAFGDAVANIIQSQEIWTDIIKNIIIESIKSINNNTFKQDISAIARIIFSQYEMDLKKKITTPIAQNVVNAVNSELQNRNLGAVFILQRNDFNWNILINKLVETIVSRFSLVSIGKKIIKAIQDKSTGVDIISDLLTKQHISARSTGSIVTVPLRKNFIYSIKGRANTSTTPPWYQVLINTYDIESGFSSFSDKQGAGLELKRHGIDKIYKLLDTIHEKEPKTCLKMIKDGDWLIYRLHQVLPNLHPEVTWTTWAREVVSAWSANRHGRFIPFEKTIIENGITKKKQFYIREDYLTDAQQEEELKQHPRQEEEYITHPVFYYRSKQVLRSNKYSNNKLPKYY